MKGSLNPQNLKILVLDFIPRGFEQGPQIAAGKDLEWQRVETSNGSALTIGAVTQGTGLGTEGPGMATQLCGAFTVALPFEVLSPCYLRSLLETPGSRTKNFKFLGFRYPLNQNELFHTPYYPNYET